MMLANEADLAEPDWPATNCYIDAWTLILRAWGLDSRAAQGVTAAMGYEGDQFTFFKFQQYDLELLYGILMGELLIYRSLEQHILEQINLGRWVLVEVDGYYLPDTRSTSYRERHVKTTIGVDHIDIDGGCLGYFHSAGHYELADEDYGGVFGKLPPRNPPIDRLPPYVEFAGRRWPPLSGRDQVDAAVQLLRRHLRRRPARSPIRQYRDDFARHMDCLLTAPDTFHDYAFATFRQLGANFELLAGHTDWLRAHGAGDLTKVSDAAREISASAKAMQFKVARCTSRGRFDACESLFDKLEKNHDIAIEELERQYG